MIHWARGKRVMPLTGERRHAGPNRPESMNSLSENPEFPFNLVIDAAGLGLFVVSVRLLGLGISDIFGSALQFTGAAIWYFGCGELALSGWRTWRYWRSRWRPARS